MIVIFVFGVCSAIDLIDVLDTDMPFHQDISFYCINMRFGLYLAVSLQTPRAFVSRGRV